MHPVPWFANRLNIVQIFPHPVPWFGSSLNHKPFKSSPYKCSTFKHALHIRGTYKRLAGFASRDLSVHSLRFAVPVTFKRGAYKRGAYKRGAYIRGACKCPTFKHRYHVREPLRVGRGVKTIFRHQVMAHHHCPSLYHCFSRTI